MTDGLLARADLITLVDVEDTAAQFTVRWDDVLRLAGDALREDVGHDPPRWCHHSWPDSDALTLLKASAVPLPPYR